MDAELFRVQMRNALFLMWTYDPRPEPEIHWKDIARID